MLKDLNFIELSEKLQISDEKKVEALRILEEDSEFLAANNLMDYSLLFIKV